MTDAPKFRVDITANDRASAELEKVSNSLKKTAEAAENTGRHLNHSGSFGSAIFSRLSGNITLLHGHFFHLNERIAESSEHLKGWGERFATLLPMLEAFGAVASVGGFFHLIDEKATEFAGLQSAAIKIGFTTEQLEALNYAAARTSVPLEAAQNSMVKLNASMVAALHTKSLAGVFKSLHVSVKGMHGQMLPATQVMLALADALRKVDQAHKTFDVKQIFGKGGAEILPMLELGSDKLKQLAKRAEEIGPHLTPKNKKDMLAFHSAWVDLGIVTSNAMTKIAGESSMALTPIVVELTKFISDHKDEIARDIKFGIHDVERFVKSIDFGKVEQRFDHFTTDIGKLSDALGGLKSAAEWAMPAVGLVVAGAIKTIGAAMLENPGTVGFILTAEAFANRHKLEQLVAPEVGPFGKVDTATGKPLGARPLTLEQQLVRNALPAPVRMMNSAVSWLRPYLDAESFREPIATVPPRRLDLQPPPAISNQAFHSDALARLSASGRVGIVHNDRFGPDVLDRLNRSALPAQLDAPGRDWSARPAWADHMLHLPDGSGPRMSSPDPYSGGTVVQGGTVVHRFVFAFDNAPDGLRLTDSDPADLRRVQFENLGPNQGKAFTQTGR